MNTTSQITAELIDYMGSDLTVVNAARVSMNKHKAEFDNSDEKLIKYLAAHNHFTPFTHPQITLRETIPIFVARQRFKHMVGFSYNEVSRRYVKDDVVIYVPEAFREAPQGNIKQGSGNTLPTSDSLISNYISSVENSLNTYELLLLEGVAPEQARMVLPQSMMTTYYVTGSLAAFARAYKLRIDPHSQKEIQELAKEWDRVIRPLFPHSWSALTTDLFK